MLVLYTNWNYKFLSHYETPFIFNRNSKYINQMYLVVKNTAYH